ncbi:MAG: L,D-transpeptidase family protein [Firmicutes bacterium]|nr:L,D-transpeptidase family protein [Bacillota bacterium]
MHRLRWVEKFLVWLTAGSLLLPLTACGVFWFLARDKASAQSSIDIYPAKVQELDIPRDEAQMGQLEEACCESDRVLYFAKPPMTGEDVEELQRGLQQLGVYHGPISGTFDRRTMEAVIAFQRQEGLTSDGVVGPVTWQALADDFPVPVVEGSGQVPEGEKEIVIDVARRQLIVYIDGKEYQRYPVAVGLGKTPTPIGEFRIVQKSMNWGGGFGTRWLGLNVPWGIYGIHGTNKPWSIGTQASAGCVRMFNRHVEQLYRITPEGTLVRIVGRPSDPVTRLLKPGNTGQDVVTLQLALAEKGYDVGLADARYGEQTASAVKQLQEDYGLYPDGLGWPDVYLLLGVR